MSKKTVASAAVAMVALGFGGCAEYSNWRPTVDTYNDPRAQYVTQDDLDCKQLAKQASGGGVTETATGMALGGLVGAAAGAAIGAAVGAPGTGAALGAAAGGFGGGTAKGISSEQQYKDAYITCMKRRGHNVINY